MLNRVPRRKNIRVMEV